ncbi:MAG: hypothetical protein WKF49_01325 [Thermoleophilaceae bacterium]
MPWAARVRAPFLAAAERLRWLAFRVSADFLAAVERDAAFGLLDDPEPGEEPLAREEDFAFVRLEPDFRAPPEPEPLVD